MKFIIQTINSQIRGVEEFNLKRWLDRQKWKGYTYILSDTSVHDDIDDIADWIPVGSIEFLEEHLNRYHNVKIMTPIEVPSVLRVNKYLKRKYYQVNSRDELPDKGYWFIKKIDRLKEMCTLGVVGNFKDKLDDGKYIVSEVIEDIDSEYRVIVCNNVIKGIQYYIGEPTVLPDVELIKEMVKVYNNVEGRPKAYSLDIAHKEGLGTFILEVHAFASLGTYGFDDEMMPKMYSWGYEFYKKNK